MTREERYESLMTKKVKRSLTVVAQKYDPENWEDLIQDTFLMSWRGIDKFKGGKFFSWCCTILKYQFMNRWRNARRKKNGRILLRSQAVPDHKAEYIVAPEEVDNSLSDEMTNALKEIPLSQREMIILVVIEGLTYDEAAKKVGIPAGTVMSRLFRAKEQMRRELERAS